MKSFKLFSILMFLSVCSLTFVSCDKEEPAPTPTITERDIEGYWIYESRSEYEVYYFEDGMYEHAYENVSFGEEISDFGRYSIVDGKLKLKSQETNNTDTYTISLNGNILTIDGRDFERYNE